MTLADLPVLNPSTPGREAQRATLVALLFLAFGALYAFARVAAAAPPDLSASTDVVFGFAFPRGWGIVPSLWEGTGGWPMRLKAAELATALAVTANVILAIALIAIMHPDILSRQGPQYVSPARRITTVIIAFVLAFLVYSGVQVIDTLLANVAYDPGGTQRRLVGLGAISALLFGGVWSFIGPKDFGRRIPLRISHGALGGLAVWAAITLATLLSAQPRAFLSSSFDTFYTLLTLDYASGTPGATAGWAVSSDVLTAAMAMACAGALLVFTAPQSLGPGNRRGAAMVAGVLGAAVAVVSSTTYGATTGRAAEVNVNVVQALGLETGGGPGRVPVLLVGGNAPASARVVSGIRSVPSATADDCAHNNDDRVLPVASAANVRKLNAYLGAQGRNINGTILRAASCRAALQALRWDVRAAREGIFLDAHPERVGALVYLYAMSGLGSPQPGDLSRILRAMVDTTRYLHGSEAAQRFATFARIAGDTDLEAQWRPRAANASGVPSGMLARPAYTDGSVTGRLPGRTGWRVGLILADDPSSGADPSQYAPRNEGFVLASMVASTDVVADGRFSFSGLRDGYYILALLAPDGVTSSQLAAVAVRNDPGVFRLDPARKALDLGAIEVTY